MQGLLAFDSRGYALGARSKMSMMLAAAAYEEIRTTQIPSNRLKNTLERHSMQARNMKITNAVAMAQDGKGYPEPWPVVCRILSV